MSLSAEVEEAQSDWLISRTLYTVHNRIGLCLWKQDSMREFRTLFVTHTDFIREKLDKMERVSV